MYTVHQHWDPLKVCAVGQSYPPEFYSFVKNTKARNALETIAQETEEDYQTLIALLKSFGVEIHRPNISTDYDSYLIGGRYSRRYAKPPMCPRDHTVMIGNTFYVDGFIQNGIDSGNGVWNNLIDNIKSNGNDVVCKAHINGASTTRIGKDLYHGTLSNNTAKEAMAMRQHMNETFPNHRNHVVNTEGHADGCFCPVVPGLIISLYDIQNYTVTFPDWEIVHLPGQSWAKVYPFLELKGKNQGKWWVPGQELNDDFTNFVEEWLGHWVGYVEETVFDVNMLVIDKKNVVCNNYNEKVFEALERHGITPHVVNFRHRYFWDGGLHCITSDIHRESTQEDYFPERGKNGYLPQDEEVIHALRGQ